eukprot:582992-Hanusia_phi.AAC.11
MARWGHKPCNSMLRQGFENGATGGEQSKKIAMRFENRAQIQFVENLISEAQSKSRCGNERSRILAPVKAPLQEEVQVKMIKRHHRSKNLFKLTKIYNLLRDAVNDSIQRSFARNFVHKELVVMVMSDETESLDKAFNVQIMTALKEFDLKTLPILFVGGKSLGDREEVAELAKQEKLKDAILSALPETICEEEKKIPAKRPRIAHQSTKKDFSVCSRPHPPSYDEDLIQYFEKCQNITIQGIVNSFIQEISQLLGNFPLPVDLLKQAPTPVKIVEFIEEHCPAQGDCQKCPSKMNCKIHEENSTDVVDIEDFGKPH